MQFDLIHMMRRARTFPAVLLLALVCVSCAGRSQTAKQPAPPAADFEDAVAASLVFNPPVTANQPELDLSRAGRGPSAFVSYDQITSSFFYLRFQDRQFVGADGRSERRVITETFGISHR